MTLELVNKAIQEYGNNLVTITLSNNQEIRGILQEAFLGYPHDPRGYTEPYLFVVRVDANSNNPVKINCSEIKSIKENNN